MAAEQATPDQGPERRLSLVEHLAELRRRLIISLLAVAVTTALSFTFTRQIFDFLKRPAPPVQFIYTQPTELLSTYFKVAIISGLVLAMPIWLYQVVLFVAPGLNPTERRYVFLLLPGALLSFIAGAAFAYFVLFPPTFQFLFTFGQEIAEPQIRIGAYVSLVANLMLWIGLVFELPLVMYFLGRIGVLSPERVKGIRRPAIVLAFVGAAVITPTADPITMTLVAVPIIALFEVGLLLARWGQRQRRIAQRRRESASASLG
ncbi:MAG: twin-arginine translocase subunit TatC [Chloroflexi bacterium]|nr:twin-arginine translocase subunit TatC [Chloroflexota bacterium]